MTSCSAPPWATTWPSGPLNLGRGRREAEAIVDEVPEPLRLEGFKGRITYSLSDGEKKLVATSCLRMENGRVASVD